MPQSHHRLMQCEELWWSCFSSMVKSSVISPCSVALLMSLFNFLNWGASLCFSFRSSWPGRQEDPNLPRARRISMTMTKACPPAVPWTTNMSTWISETFSTRLFKAWPFGLFCRNSHQLAVQLCGSRTYQWQCLLFMFLVPNKKHLLSCVDIFWSISLLKRKIHFF